MIQQMTGGGWKVFSDDTGQFIGAFHDQGLAKIVDGRGRTLTSGELDEFSGKIIATPQVPGIDEPIDEASKSEEIPDPVIEEIDTVIFNDDESIDKISNIQEMPKVKKATKGIARKAARKVAKKALKKK